MFGKEVKQAYGRRPQGGLGLVLVVAHAARVPKAWERCSLCAMLAGLTGHCYILEPFLQPSVLLQGVALQTAVRVPWAGRRAGPTLSFLSISTFKASIWLPGTAVETGPTVLHMPFQGT